MKTLRQMMDLIEAAQMPVNEGWEFRFKKPDPTWVAAKEKINRVGKEKIQQMLNSSGLKTDDIDLFIAQLPIYLENNQVDAEKASFGVGGLAPFVDYREPGSVGYLDYISSPRQKQETKNKIKDFVVQLNQELQKNVSNEIDEASPAALAKIDQLSK